MSWVVIKSWWGYWRVFELEGYTGMDQTWHASFRDKIEAEVYAERRNVRTALLERGRLLTGDPPK